MAEVHKGRFTARMEGEFVVFLIGMRINKLWAVHKWLPVLFAMPRMLRELGMQPELGLLHAQLSLSGRVIQTTQYWRSFEQLHAYAHAKDKKHLPAWTEFNRKVSGNGSVGIFHETYVVKPGGWECVYGNMPRFGLAKAGEMIPAVGRLQSAKSRMEGE
jgi:hypothetical protein